MESEELDFECSVKSVLLKARGRIDAVFGNIIIEFKKDLPTGLDMAKIEMKKYFQAYLEINKSNFLGVATDGLLFKVFAPIIEGDIVAGIKEISELDLRSRNPEQIFLWFDSYFFTEQKIIPTSSDIKQRFGLDSPTFFTVCDELEKIYKLLEKHDDKPTIMKYNNWSKYLEVVYGDKPKDKTLFFKHTYLSTLVKLLVHVKITEGKPNSFDEIIPILYGNKFEQAGIINFMEDDFFTWVIRPHIRKTTSKLFLKLLKETYVYDLEKINEDVLKELYQELIDSEIKQSLGEFYTPDWLADTIIKESITDLQSRVLDPSCGSGTFLFKTIQFKYKELMKKKWQKSKILNHILENVVGFDVHPLAVIIAKTNYLLALKDLLHYKQKEISIPIYLSDSLKIPKRKQDVTTSVTTFEFDAINHKFYFPLNVTKNITKMDEVVNIMREHGNEYQNYLSKNIKYFDAEEFCSNASKGFKNKMLQTYSEEESDILVNSLNTLYKLISSGLDSVWPYILRNMYKPITMALNPADIILGNPPWITMRNIKSTSYQEFLKTRSKNYGLNTETKIIPHIEMATLFFCHVSKSYLKDNGKIGFVMPRSILVSTNHKKFLKFLNPVVKLEQIYDLSNSKKIKVSPLFKIPSCVIFCSKNKKTTYPVPVKIFNGELVKVNSQMNESDKILTTTYNEFKPLNYDKNEFSYYYDNFFQGATIVPSTIWRIEIKNDKNLGFNPELPYVKSSTNMSAHKPWSKISMDGNIEREFLFTSIPSKMIRPFGYTDKLLIILPILCKNITNFQMINSYKEIENTHRHFSRYLKQAEKHWEENRTQKSKSTTLYQRVNYQNTLINQNPHSKFKVLYVGFGTYMTSCVVDASRPHTINIGESEIQISRIYSDSTTYYFDAKSLDEAHYLCAILNSRYLDNIIKPFQPKGNFGAWAIHRIPLQSKIPKFDNMNDKHLRLSKLSKICTEKSEQFMPILSNIKSIGVIRSRIREELRTEYLEIDEIAKKIIKIKESKS